MHKYDVRQLYTVEDYDVLHIICIYFDKCVYTLLRRLNAGSLGIAPTFLKLDSWSPVAGSIPIISTKGINQIKKEKL